MSNDLSQLKQKLESKGLSQQTRFAIRSSKICIIDDKIEDLQGMTAALKAEGFTNIVELKTVDSIESILHQQFDLIVLDLGGIATELSRDDGYGVLNRLKEVDPALAILVITGSTTSPDKVSIVSKADLIRSKPVYPAELTSDVDLILRSRKDELWASLELLQELLKINHKIQDDLSIFDKIRLHFLKKSIVDKIKNDNRDVIAKLIKISKITTKLGQASIKIARIVNGLGV